LLLVQAGDAVAPGALTVRRDTGQALATC